MDSRALERVARFVVQHNAIDAAIAAMVGRPVTAGHLGEWIASQMFDVSSRPRARERSKDGSPPAPLRAGR
ncbi:MAG: hypothetical protein ACRDZ4_01930 [Egibacteraceae bacterium]